jgi:hypothetical protein
MAVAWRGHTNLPPTVVDITRSQSPETDEDGSSPSPIPSLEPLESTRSLRHMIRQVDNRTAHVEKLLGQVLSHLPSWDLRSSSLANNGGGDTFADRADGVGDGDDVEQAVNDLLSVSVGTGLLVVSGLNIHDRNSMVDPVGTGLVSATGMKDVCVRYVINNAFVTLRTR